MYQIEYVVENRNRKFWAVWHRPSDTLACTHIWSKEGAQAIADALNVANVNPDIFEASPKRPSNGRS